MLRGRTVGAKHPLLRRGCHQCMANSTATSRYETAFFALSFFKAPESPQFPPARPLEAPQLGRKHELDKAH